MATWKTAARPNAGRRKKRGKAFVPPTVGHPGPADWLLMSRDELVAMRSPDAVAELYRRGRDADGVKLAWKMSKAQARAAANPKKARGKLKPSGRVLAERGMSKRREEAESAAFKRFWSARLAEGHSPEKIRESWRRLTHPTPAEKAEDQAAIRGFTGQITYGTPPVTSWGPTVRMRGRLKLDRTQRKIRSVVDSYRAFRDEMKKEGMSPAEINALWEARKGRSNPAQPYYSWARLRGGRFFFDPALPKDFGEIYILVHPDPSDRPVGWDQRPGIMDFSAWSSEEGCREFLIFQEAGHEFRTVFIGEVFRTGSDTGSDSEYVSEYVKVLWSKRYMLPARQGGVLMAQTEKMIAEALVAVRTLASISSYSFSS